MSRLIIPQLLKIIACPDCSGELAENGNLLHCDTCGGSYQVKGGVPLLYPRTLDVDHLREEETLAAMMRSPRASRREQLISAQWKASKQEFWRLVEDQVTGEAKSFINVGCGYDTNFKAIEQGGHLFVNFDLVQAPLLSLIGECGAKSCVAGDINSLPFKEGSFDYVICIDVLHHEVLKMRNVLESVRNLLKSGGVLFLQDPNAWGLFQFPKSVLLPRSVHRVLRQSYHQIHRSAHRPADYEFATSVWKTIKLLREIGFRQIKAYPNYSYPNIGAAGLQVYHLLRRWEFIRKYNNYHYTLSMVRPD